MISDLVIQLDHGKVIHNCTQGQVADDFKNAEEIVRDLLTRLVNLMKGMLSLSCKMRKIFLYVGTKPSQNNIDFHTKIAEKMLKIREKV